MLRLVLLGGLRLEDDAGPVEGRASQKRRLALLALLANPPGEVVTRDKLIGYLWPERDQDRARHLLSAALYDLRSELGEDVVDTPGDGVVLNPESVTSDAWQFMEALDAGEGARAVELYGGPFLDGVHLGGAHEFERWVDGERQRHEWAYHEALEKLARQRARAGDAKGAAEAWRRLAVEDPTSTTVAVGYMTALEAAGDRAAALQFAQVHTALLREEFEAEPDPEVVALADRLRNEPQPAPGPAAVTKGGEVGAGPDAGGAQPEPAQRERERLEPAAGRPWLRAGLAALLVTAMAGGLALWLGSATAPSDQIPVAVLPFENVSDESGNEYFADGLTEEILNALARLEQFHVPARTSAFAFKGQRIDVREAARQLTVDYVVEGTVRKEGDALRISVMLVNAATGYELWSERYDRRMGGVFAVQEEIGRAVVAALLPRLAGELPPLVTDAPRNPEAYDIYLQARAHWYERTPEALERALEDFQRAIQLDSTYALAYAGIADVYNLLGAYEYGILPPSEAYPRARAAAEAALRADPELAAGHAALANTLFNYDWDWSHAEREYRRAIELNPGFVMAHHWYSLLLSADGRFEEALSAIRRARELDPRSALIATSLARHYYFRRQFDRAVAAYGTALELDSAFVLTHMGKGLVAVQTGRPDIALAEYRTAERLLGRATPTVTALTVHALGAAAETGRARSLYDRLLAAAATRYVPPHYLATAAVGLGLDEEALRWLDAALEERSGSLIYVRLDPLIDPLRGLAGFQSLMDRAVAEGLPPASDLLGPERASDPIRWEETPALPEPSGPARGG